MEADGGNKGSGSPELSLARRKTTAEAATARPCSLTMYVCHKVRYGDGQMTLSRFRRIERLRKRRSRSSVLKIDAVHILDNSVVLLTFHRAFSHVDTS
ncbi:hypothetical protein EVAR_34375_1 [Eumeta japonica]|uniref:Uncharacterized protein n=1 Tax=Eumeta variegata TaxID=151549 RepID=A0A4C1YSJ8_EUMVA|nr:hypothetical protein EVAR_34375_1 [Eumeta japonica]